MNLGTYQDLQEIGRGGMGIVYKARDWEGRTVAIKRIQGVISRDQTCRLAFVREALMTAQLKHKNIIKVFDVGQHAGTLYIVMEYLQGQTLSQLVKRSKAIGLCERLEIIRQACDALQHAHERGIIHRDIKPGNIFICRDSTVKILDFGIAALFQGASALSSSRLGTPYYMSPEQILGSNLGPASDIWSIGVTLFEFLRGRLPFVAATSQVLFKEILTAQIPVTPPSLPFAKAMDQVLSCALAKQPEKRYSSALEMAIDIEKLIPLVAQYELELLANTPEDQFVFNLLTLDTLAVHIDVGINKSSAQDASDSEGAARKLQDNPASPGLGSRVILSKRVDLVKMPRLPKAVQVLVRSWFPLAIFAAISLGYQAHEWQLQAAASFMTGLLAFICVALLVGSVERSAVWLRSVPRCPGCRSRMHGCREWIRYPNSPEDDAILERDCMRALREGAWEEAAKLFTILGRTNQGKARVRYQLTFYECKACDEYAGRLALYELRPHGSLDSELWDQRSDAIITHTREAKS